MCKTNFGTPATEKLIMNLVACRQFLDSEYHQLEVKKIERIFELKLCTTCEGHGFITWFSNYGREYDDCPDCFNGATL